MKKKKTEETTAAEEPETTPYVEQPEADEPELVEPELVEPEEVETESVEPEAAGAKSAAEPAAAEAATSPEDEALETRLLRLQADFDNYRKRMVRERAEWQRQAHETLLQDLLPVLDHYELGLNSAIKLEADAAMVDGFRMVYDQFNAALSKHRVEPIESEGQPFDPNRHEAITYVPSEEHPAETVIAQTRRGYLLDGKLLRAAQVVVSSGPAAAEAAADAGADAASAEGDAS
jgi:molecular chaperone GrpE